MFVSHRAYDRRQIQIGPIIPPSKILSPAKDTAPHRSPPKATVIRLESPGPRHSPGPSNNPTGIRWKTGLSPPLQPFNCLKRTTDGFPNSSPR